MIKFDLIEVPLIESFYLNRTRLYLLPAVNLLKSLPEIAKLKKNINTVTTLYDGGLKLFIKNNSSIRDLIQSLKDNHEYIDDYIYSKNIHVVVLKPNINYTAFLEGRYSEIYTKEQLVKCFDSKSDILKILKKDPIYLKKYIKYIKDQFGESIRESSIKDHKEYDIIPCLNQEIINE